MLGVYHYRDAINAVDVGAVNLSGLAYSLQAWFPHIEEEMALEDYEARHVIEKLVRACDSLSHLGTHARNTHPIIMANVIDLARMSFETDYLRYVPSHPIFRLMVSQMAQLSGVIIQDVHYLDRWREAYNDALEVVSQSEDAK